MNPKHRIIFLVGPTAVGKTGVSMSLAYKFNAEIISCDSMQVYKKMDILTSKPSLLLLNRVKHHLIGVVAPQKEYNVARFRIDALKKIKDIIKCGKVPLLVGGTGLYMSILVDGIFQTKAQNPAIRRRLYEEVEKLGSQYLFEKLHKIDPLSAKRIHPHDTKRIIRALEVFQITGKPISQLQKQRSGLWDKYDVRIFCLNMERDKLYGAIEKRVDKMFKKGLLKEVSRLLKLRLSKTAACAIGINELKGYFEGQCGLEEAKRRMCQNTRNYAKRQLTWFRKDKRIQWIEVGDKESASAIASKIAHKL